MAGTLQNAVSCFANRSQPLESRKEDSVVLEESAAVIAVALHPLHWKGYHSRPSVGLAPIALERISQQALSCSLEGWVL